MTMPGRNFNAGSGYRYGFNGKELDKEVAGTTTYDYGFRIYSPALGKFLSVDPLTQTYPWYTPYQFAGNKPIIAIDIDGLEEWMQTQSIRLKQKYTLLSNKPSSNLKEDGLTKVINGVGEGITNVGKATWNTITHPIESLKSAEEFLFQGGMSMSTVKVVKTPIVDAKSDEFINDVIYGDAKTRARYATELIGGYYLGKGLGKVKNFALNKVKKGGPTQSLLNTKCFVAGTKIFCPCWYVVKLPTSLLHLKSV